MNIKKWKLDLGIWDYSVTRKVTLSRTFALFLWALSLTYVAAVIIIVLAAQEFEYIVQPPTDDYNSTFTLWYHSLLPTALKSYTPSARRCNPNILRIGDQLSTNNTALFTWTLEQISEAAGDDPNGGISYANNLLRLCYPALIFLIPPTDLSQTIQATIYTYCATTRDQLVLLSTSLETLLYSPRQMNGEGNSTVLGQNFTNLLGSWVSAEVNLLNSGPYSNDLQNSQPVLGPTVIPVVMQFNIHTPIPYLNLSTALNRFQYLEPRTVNITVNGTYTTNIKPLPDGTPVNRSFIYDGYNSPASDFWVLNVTTGNGDGGHPISQVVFLANSSVDMDRTDPGDLTLANKIIPQGIDYMTFWATVNWLFVSLYWTSLIDFGQYQPYQTDGEVLLSTNNIFSNNTLLRSYVDFYNAHLIPYSGNISLSPLNYETILDPFPTVFLQSYSCTQLTPKSPLTVIVAVVIGCYAFIFGGYSFIKFILAMWYRHRHESQFNDERSLEKFNSSEIPSVDEEIHLIEGEESKF